MRWITRPVIREAITVAARQHGSVLNRAQFARQLRLSIPTVRALLAAMATMGWIRLLPAWCPQGVAGCFRRPRVQLTSAPLLSYVLGPGHEGLATAASLSEGVIRAERRIDSTSRFFHFGTYDLRPLDLIVERAGVRTGYLFLGSAGPGRREALPLRRAVKQGVVHAAFLVHTGQGGRFCGRGVLAVPASVFLARYEDFTAPQERYEVWHAMLRWLILAAVGEAPAPGAAPGASPGESPCSTPAPAAGPNGMTPA
jgi:hypothetical protein